MWRLPPAGKLIPRNCSNPYLLLPNFLFMSSKSPPCHPETEESPDDSLCSAVNRLFLPEETPAPVAAEYPPRAMNGGSRIDRAWDHWRRLGAPKLVVAPMVDNSELPFRMLCRKYGAEAAYTPMLHSRIFSETEKYRLTEFTTCKV